MVLLGSMGVGRVNILKGGAIFCKRRRGVTDQLWRNDHRREVVAGQYRREVGFGHLQFSLKWLLFRVLPLVIITFQFFMGN